MAELFPFVVIPDSVTLEELAQNKPFLLQVILTIASVVDSVRQARMAQDVIEYLSEHMPIRAEKSLDLLQGLLIYIAWFVPLLRFRLMDRAKV